MTEHFWWYLSRSSGIVASILVAAAVIWGLLLSTRILQGGPKPAWYLDLHRMLGALSVLFTLVHVFSLMFDGYLSFSLRDSFVPFASQWHPNLVALGVLGLYGLIAVEATSLVMKRLPRKLWHVIHLSSYVVFWLVAMHGALAGSDAANPLFRWGSVAAILTVLGLTLYRVLVGRRARKAARAAARRPAAPEAGTTDDRAGSVPPPLERNSDLPPVAGLTSNMKTPPSRERRLHDSRK